MRNPKETDIPSDEVPVLMKDNWLVRPFQLLVTGFGFPRYSEIQPTMLVAISFLTMYGMMFGDVGQGAVLAIGGFVTRKRARSPQIRDLGTIICYAGLAAIRLRLPVRQRLRQGNAASALGPADGRAW